MESENQRVKFLDVGHGDSSVIYLNSGHSENENVVIVDIVDSDKLLTELTSHKIKVVDLIIISHSDADHCRGVNDFLEKYMAVGHPAGHGGGRRAGRGRLQRQRRERPAGKRGQEQRGGLRRPAGREGGPRRPSAPAGGRCDPVLTGQPDRGGRFPDETPDFAFALCAADCSRFGGGRA